MSDQPVESQDGRGYMLRGHALLGSGETQPFAWLALHRGDHSLRWQLRRIVPDLGFGATRSRNLSMQFNHHWPKWSAVLESTGMHVAQNWGASRDSLRVRYGVESQEVRASEEFYWCSTPALLFMLLHWRSSERGKTRNITEPF
eukprot:1419508-Amphidinium_carterae.1